MLAARHLSVGDRGAHPPQRPAPLARRPKNAGLSRRCWLPVACQALTLSELGGGHLGGHQAAVPDSFRIAFSGGNAALITDTGTALLLYRVLEAPTQYADLGVGFRAWGFSSNLTLNPGILPGTSVNRSASWVDPLIGGRYHIDLPSGFGLTAYGDVGGFGVGAHSDWQLIGTVDYTPTPWINLHLGYRSLNFNYTASGGFDLGFDVHMKGPILAATFKF